MYLVELVLHAGFCISNIIVLANVAKIFTSKRFENSNFIAIYASSIWGYLVVYYMRAKNLEAAPIYMLILMAAHALAVFTMCIAKPSQ